MRNFKWYFTESTELTKFENFKTVCKNIGNYGEIDKKPLKNYAKNINELLQTILEVFFSYILFSIKPT